VCPIKADYDDAEVWVVSGNTSPSGSVAVDIIKSEKRDRGFNPFLTKPGEKAPIGQWRGEDKRPGKGFCWIYGNQAGSDYYPDKLEGKSPDDLRKLNLKKVEPKETPGSKPGKVKQDEAEEEKKDDSKDDKKDDAKDDKKDDKKDDAKDEKKDDKKDDDKDDKKDDKDDSKDSKDEKKKDEPKQKPKNDGPPPPAACPPKTGFPRMPLALDGSLEVTSQAISDLYHQAERGNGGFFPMGDSSLFHCGVH